MSAQSKGISASSALSSPMLDVLCVPGRYYAARGISRPPVMSETGGRRPCRRRGVGSSGSILSGDSSVMVSACSPARSSSAPRWLGGRSSACCCKTSAGGITPPSSRGDALCHGKPRRASSSSPRRFLRPVHDALRDATLSAAGRTRSIHHVTIHTPYTCTHPVAGLPGEDRRECFGHVPGSAAWPATRRPPRLSPAGQSFLLESASRALFEAHARAAPTPSCRRQRSATPRSSPRVPCSPSGTSRSYRAQTQVTCVSCLPHANGVLRRGPPRR